LELKNGAKDDIKKRVLWIKLMDDYVYQTTCNEFKITCKNLRINPTFKSHNNRKGNTDTSTLYANKERRMSLD